jgi:hypothetical protein
VKVECWGFEYRCEISRLVFIIFRKIIEKCAANLQYKRKWVILGKMPGITYIFKQEMT